MKLRILACLLFLVGTAVASAESQWPASLTPGTRIRVRLPEVQYQETLKRGQLIRGRVRELISDTLYLAVTDSVGPLAVPRSLIQHLFGALFPRERWKSIRMSR